MDEDDDTYDLPVPEPRDNAKGSSPEEIAKTLAGVALLCFLFFALLRVFVKHEEATLADRCGTTANLDCDGETKDKDFWDRVGKKQTELEHRIDWRDKRIEKLSAQSEQCAEAERKAVMSLNGYGGNPAGAEVQKRALEEKTAQSKERLTVENKLKGFEVAFLTDTFADMEYQFNRLMAMQTRRLSLLQKCSKLATAEEDYDREGKLNSIKKLLYAGKPAEDIFKQHLTERLDSYKKAVNVMVHVAQSDATGDFFVADASLHTGKTPDYAKSDAHKMLGDGVDEAFPMGSPGTGLPDESPQEKENDVDKTVDTGMENVMPPAEFTAPLADDGMDAAGNAQFDTNDRALEGSDGGVDDTSAPDDDEEMRKADAADESREEAERRAEADGDTDETITLPPWVGTTSTDTSGATDQAEIVD